SWRAETSMAARKLLECVARTIVLTIRQESAMQMQKSVAAQPTAVYSPTPIPVGQFVDGMRELAQGVITKQKIYEYLCANEIRDEDLSLYQQWLPDRHTRNKIFRNDLIEVMLICWPIGAVTPLHTHNGQ